MGCVLLACVCLSILRLLNEELRENRTQVQTTHNDIKEVQDQHADVACRCELTADGAAGE